MPFDPLIGVDIGEVSLIPCTEAAGTGTPTQVTAEKEQFRAVFDGGNVTSGIDQEDIRSITSQRKNMVNLARGSEVTFDEIMMNVTAPSKIIKLTRSYELFYVTIVLGGETGKGYLRLSSVGVPIQGDGKKTCSISLTPTDHGSDSFAWSPTA